MEEQNFQRISLKSLNIETSRINVSRNKTKRKKNLKYKKTDDHFTKINFFSPHSQYYKIFILRLNHKFNRQRKIKQNYSNF